MPPVKPMLAKVGTGIPPGQLYEPKWDGFRSVVFRDGDEVEIGSRNERPMTRYFPEVVEAVRANLPERCVVDGEIVLVDPSAVPWTSRRCSCACTRPRAGSGCWPSRRRPASSRSTCSPTATRTSPARPFAERRGRSRRRSPTRRRPSTSRR